MNILFYIIPFRYVKTALKAHYHCNKASEGLKRPLRSMSMIWSLIYIYVINTLQYHFHIYLPLQNCVSLHKNKHLFLLYKDWLIDCIGFNAVSAILIFQLYYAGLYLRMFRSVPNLLEIVSVVLGKIQFILDIIYM